MLTDSVYIDKIEIVAKGMGELAKDIVFVGGSAVPLYIEDEAVREVRPTKDVDCIIKITTRTEYYRLEEKLRRLGFKNSVDRAAPICRWIFKNIPVDIMPTEDTVLGFSNRWYKDGIKNSKQVELPGGTSVNIFSIAYFIAAKIEAFKNREKESDYRWSRDIEDIITIFDGRLNIDELYNEPETVVKYLKKTFREFLKDDRFIEAIAGHLGPGLTGDKRAKRIKKFLFKFSKNQG